MNVRFIVFLAALCFIPTAVFSQQIVDQKKVVAFAFGDIHLPSPEATGSIGA